MWNNDRRKYNRSTFPPVRIRAAWRHGLWAVSKELEAQLLNATAGCRHLPSDWALPCFSFVLCFHFNLERKYISYTIIKIKDIDRTYHQQHRVQLRNDVSQYYFDSCYQLITSNMKHVNTKQYPLMRFYRNLLLCNSSKCCYSHEFIQKKKKVPALDTRKLFIKLRNSKIPYRVSQLGFLLLWENTTTTNSEKKRI